MREPKARLSSPRRGARPDLAAHDTGRACPTPSLVGLSCPPVAMRSQARNWDAFLEEVAEPVAARGLSDDPAGRADGAVREQIAARCAMRELDPLAVAEEEDGV